MVETVGELGVGRPAQRKVPFKHVVFQRRRRVELRRVVGEFARLREDAFDRRRLFVVRSCRRHPFSALPDSK